MLQDLPTDEPLVNKALYFARKAHTGQKRLSGEDFVNHPISVAKLIYHWVGLNPNLIAAALLHDVTEDTNTTIAELKQLFGADVANLVDGVSKLKSTKRSVNRIKNIKRILKIGYLDPRVFVLKLADRLHNLQTLSAMNPTKRIEKAEETKEIYARLAESLGMWEVKKELEDYAFYYLQPREYSKTKKEIYNDPRVRFYYKEIIREIKNAIPKKISYNIYPSINGIQAVENKKVKNLQAGLTFNKNIFYVNDVVSIRITTNTVGNCYRILGIVESHYKDKIDEDRFDNYLLAPRANSYSALQTTVMTKYGAVEIAITTHNRETYNRRGILSVLSIGTKSDLSKYIMKVVFSPKGNVYYIPKEARILDFIFLYPRIFTYTKQIYIDGKRSNIYHKIPNGATITTRFTKNPQKIDYEKALRYCLPTTAPLIKRVQSNKIKASFRIGGNKIVESALSQRGVLNLADIPEFAEKILYATKADTIDRLYLYTGLGLINTTNLELIFDEIGLNKEKTKFTSIKLLGKNRPGIMAKTSTIITNLGGDIRSITQYIKGSTFEIRILIKGLNKKDEEKLNSQLENTKLFSKVILV